MEGELLEFVYSLKDDLGLFDIFIIWLLLRLNSHVLRPLHAFLLSLRSALDRKDFSHQALETELRLLRRTIRGVHSAENPQVRDDNLDTERMNYLDAQERVNQDLRRGK